MTTKQPSRLRKIRSLRRLIQLAKQNKAVWFEDRPFPSYNWAPKHLPARFVANWSLLRLDGLIKNGWLYERKTKSNE